MTQKMRGQVVSGAEVPRAMTEAFRRGNLEIMDYDRMETPEADATMPSPIPGPDEWSVRR
jgi:uncharacterized protein YqfA (UPF0365 family)